MSDHMNENDLHEESSLSDFLSIEEVFHVDGMEGMLDNPMMQIGYHSYDTTSDFHDTSFDLDDKYFLLNDVENEEFSVFDHEKSELCCKKDSDVEARVENVKVEVEEGEIVYDEIERVYLNNCEKIEKEGITKEEDKKEETNHESIENSMHVNNGESTIRSASSSESDSSDESSEEDEASSEEESSQQSTSEEESSSEEEGEIIERNLKDCDLENTKSFLDDSALKVEKESESRNEENRKIENCENDLREVESDSDPLSDDDDDDGGSNSSDEEITIFNSQQLDEFIHGKGNNDAKLSKQNLSDDEEDEILEPIRSKHELTKLPAVPKIDVHLESSHQIIPIGFVSSIIECSIIVESDTCLKPLDEGSLLFSIQDRKLIGIIDEIFGPVKKPLYIVRHNSTEEINQIPNLAVGLHIGYVEAFAQFVLSEKELYKKGYDASGKDDEELDEDEVEYSDDEKESEAKRKKRNKRKNKVEGRGDEVKEWNPREEANGFETEDRRYGETREKEFWRGRGRGRGRGGRGHERMNGRERADEDRRKKENGEYHRGQRNNREYQDRKNFKNSRPKKEYVNEAFNWNQTELGDVNSSLADLAVSDPFRMPHGNLNDTKLEHHPAIPSYHPNPLMVPLPKSVSRPFPAPVSSSAPPFEFMNRPPGFYYPPNPLNPMYETGGGFPRPHGGPLYDAIRPMSFGAPRPHAGSYGDTPYRSYPPMVPPPTPGGGGGFGAYPPGYYPHPEFPNYPIWEGYTPQGYPSESHPPAPSTAGGGITPSGNSKSIHIPAAEATSNAAERHPRNEHPLSKSNEFQRFSYQRSGKDW